MNDLYARALVEELKEHNRIQRILAAALERIADAFDAKVEAGNVVYWLEVIASAANAGRS